MLHNEMAIEKCVLDTSARKQLSHAATVVLLTLALKNEQHLNIDYNFDHQISLRKSKYLYSNNFYTFQAHCYIRKVSKIALDIMLLRNMKLAVQY